MKVGLIVVAGLAIVGFWAIPHALRKPLSLGACFENVQGLRSGAGVPIAGVEVGRVTSVRAHPDRRDCPAEVLMVLSTPYELKVPNDATAEVFSEGLLGPECVAIKVENASGPPAADHAMLNTVPTVAPQRRLKRIDGVNRQAATRAQVASCQSARKAEIARRPVRQLPACTLV
jgi:ABC-type transporter Mla subunit MlaD